MSKKNQPVIVIKKITESSAEHHGGSWKVAFADFMTAMMAFFLVMWLISQSEEVKKEVADHFSTPSLVEYNFKNYGVLLTLEKLFMDLINDPLKFFQSFIRPMNFTPDVMKMGTAKVIQEHLIKELGGFTENIQSNPDRIFFKIPDYFLFERGTSINTKDFLDIMGRVQKITSSLEDSTIKIHSQVHLYTLFQSKEDQQNEENFIQKAEHISEQRLNLISKTIYKTLKDSTVDLFGKFSVFKPSVDIDYNPSDSTSSYGRWVSIEIEKKHLKNKDSEKLDQKKNKNSKTSQEINDSNQQFNLFNSELQPLIQKTKEEDKTEKSEITNETPTTSVELNQKENQEEKIKTQTIEIEKIEKEEKTQNINKNIIDTDPFDHPVSNPLDEVKINN